jgi:branched-chain amino acid transport system permease protein/neutral amino acid transport system permease protein
VHFGLPILPSVLAAFLIAGMVGVASDELVLKPFRAAGFITTAIGSIALTIALENFVRFGFGNELRGYDLPITRDWRFNGIRIGPQQVQNLAIAVAVMAALFAFLAFTRMGKAMRAVADNPMLAAIKGINADAVGRVVSFVGMGLAGLGGMLIGLDTTIDPLTGFRAMLSVFAAAVVGGLGSIPGAVIGALVVGIGEELSTLVLSHDYRSAVGFLAIVLVLTLRPRGILGQRAY